MPEPSRRLRLFLRCLAALLLGILLLAGAAMVYVQHNSVAITHTLLEDFTQRTGLHLHVRSIGLSWLPPAIQADDVRIRIKELDISVRTARLRPRLTALLQGRLELEYVALQNPVLSGSLPLPTLDLRKLGFAAGDYSGDTGGLARLDSLLPGTLQIEIDQGNFSFQAQDASSLRAGNLSCVLHLRGLQDVRGKLQAGLIRRDPRARPGKPARGRPQPSAPFFERYAPPAPAYPAASAAPPAPRTHEPRFHGHGRGLAAGS